MKYYFIAGEASGDLHASHLITALKAEDPDAEFRGFGGDLMQAAGMALVRHYRDLAYMGVVDVLLHARTILSGMRQCKDDILAWQPDVVILVDYPGFNMKIARFVHDRALCPVYYYIAPKLWAWKEWRITALRRDIDEIFSILPFEVEFFEGKHHVPIHYVGNPTVDEISRPTPDPSRQGGEASGLEDGTSAQPLPSLTGGVGGGSIALLCGSRINEVRDNLWMMLVAAAPYDADFDIQIAGVTVVPREVYEQSITKAETVFGRKIRADLVFDSTYDLLSHAKAALVTSGTATLETALFRVPQVVCYAKRYPWLMATAKKILLKVPYVSLVNLIVGREVVPEIILTDMNPETIRRHLESILPGGQARKAQLQGYEEMAARLGEPGAPQRAAKLIINLLTS
jgi:lipid-A-disaccharide synthase